MGESPRAGGEIIHTGSAKSLKNRVRKGEALGNQSLTEGERAQIEARITALEIEHHDLDDVIARLAEHPSQDQLQLRRFKKRKLILKDSISRLRILLVPDIPA